MPKMASRTRTLDYLFDQYFADGDRGPVIAFLPNRRNNDGELKESAPRLRSELDAETELLLFFIGEYLDQYRHYDNQRAKLAGILVAAVVGFSIAPFTLRPVSIEPWFEPSLVAISCLALLFLSLLSNIAARKHRFRMKVAYHRYKLARKRISELHPDWNLDDMIQKSEENAREELRRDGEREQRKPAVDDEGKTAKDSNGQPYRKLEIEAHSRGVAWNWLPHIVCAYTVLFGAIYLLMYICK